MHAIQNSLIYFIQVIFKKNQRFFKEKKKGKMDKNFTFFLTKNEHIVDSLENVVNRQSKIMTKLIVMNQRSLKKKNQRTQRRDTRAQGLCGEMTEESKI